MVYIKSDKQVDHLTAQQITIVGLTMSWPREAVQDRFFPD